MVFKFVIFLNIKMSREAKKQNTNIIKKNKKKRFKKPFVKDTKVFLKKEITKSNNMVVNNIRISQIMKNKI